MLQTHIFGSYSFFFFVLVHLIITQLFNNNHLQ